MDILVDKKLKEENIKSVIMEFLKRNEISFNVIESDNDGKICIKLDCDYDAYKNCEYYIPFTMLQSNKDICNIYPYEILYIAIEGRNSVIHLIDGTTIKTHQSISHIQEILTDNNFGRPHNSYIVNFNYVTKVTNDFVHLKYMKEEYKTYTSQRKITSFKKAFSNSENEKI